MANQYTNDALNVEKWAKDFYADYVRASQFADVMGTTDEAVIRVRNELKNSSAGTIVHVQHVARLRNAGVYDGTQLMGQEEALDNYGFALRTRFYRKAVNIIKSEQIKTELDFLNAARSALKDHFSEKLRTDIITGLQGINVKASANAGDGKPGEDTVVAYSAATTPQKNAWNVNNADRVLFGALGTNYSATHATALANIDATADKLSPAMISLAKRIAKKTGAATGANRISPYKLKDGTEWFIMYTDTNGFRDLANNSVMSQANRDARQRGLDNPIFGAGDLIWDSVIIKEIEEMPGLGAVGAGGTAKVGLASLCGRGALTLAYSQLPKPIDQDYDYGMQKGVGLEECRADTGLKTSFNGVQYGVVSVFHSSEDDA